MEDEAEKMEFQEFPFMKEELCNNMEKSYNFDLHRQQFDNTYNSISEGEALLAQLDILDRQKNEMLKEREKIVKELDKIQREIAKLEVMLVETENEWKESLYKWNETNIELKLERSLLGELSKFADLYNIDSDFAIVRDKVSEKWIEKKSLVESVLNEIRKECKLTRDELENVQAQLAEWENKKEPQPERTDAVIRNRKRLDDEGIPYQEFYKVIEFGQGLDDETCNHLEESLLKRNTTAFQRIKI